MTFTVSAVCTISFISIKACKINPSYESKSETETLCITHFCELFSCDNWITFFSYL